MGKNKYIIVHSSGGDWEGLYIDGKLKYEGQEITRYTLGQLGLLPEIKDVYAEEDWFEDRGALPEMLKEVSLEN